VAQVVGKHQKENHREDVPLGLDEAVGGEILPDETAHIAGCHIVKANRHQNQRERDRNFAQASDSWLNPAGHLQEDNHSGLLSQIHRICQPHCGCTGEFPVHFVSNQL
jgi:hypothetical protein